MPDGLKVKFQCCGFMVSVSTNSDKYDVDY
jgi:hypothetical protein